MARPRAGASGNYISDVESAIVELALPPSREEPVAGELQDAMDAHLVPKPVPKRRFRQPEPPNLLQPQAKRTPITKHAFRLPQPPVPPIPKSLFLQPKPKPRSPPGPPPGPLCHVQSKGPRPPSVPPPSHLLNPNYSEVIDDDIHEGECAFGPAGCEGGNVVYHDGPEPAQDEGGEGNWDLVTASCDNWLRAFVNVHMAVERAHTTWAGEPDQLRIVPPQLRAAMDEVHTEMGCTWNDACKALQNTVPNSGSLDLSGQEVKMSLLLGMMRGLMQRGVNEVLAKHWLPLGTSLANVVVIMAIINPRAEAASIGLRVVPRHEKGLAGAAQIVTRIVIHEIPRGGKRRAAEEEEAVEEAEEE